MIASYFVGVLQEKPAKITIQGNSEVPTPTVSLAMRQQCSNDANTLVARLSQNLDRINKSAPDGSNDMELSYDLEKSTFSNKRNSCVAELTSIGKVNGKTVTTFEIYDTVSGELLAQLTGDQKTNFIPGKVDNVTEFDYQSYKSSLGL